MNKKYFTDALSEEKIIELTEEMNEMLNFKNIPSKKKVKLSIKIISSFAAVVLLVGLFNITSVIAFINGLFFVPGIGLTENAEITAVSIDGPIKISDDMTLQFMTKVTQDGKNDLLVYIDSDSMFLINNSLHLAISVDGEIIAESPAIGGGGGNNYSSRRYVFEDFPDITEFDLIVSITESIRVMRREEVSHIAINENGSSSSQFFESDDYSDTPDVDSAENDTITIPIVLEKQKDNFAVSKEHNGIMLALYKFPKVDNFIGIDVIDKNINEDDYYINAFLSYGYSKFYDENGEEIEIAGGSSGSSGDIRLSLMETHGNASEIKGLKCKAIDISYGLMNVYSHNIELPLPKDGETIKSDAQVTVAGHVYKITEVKREGDTIYYKDNSQWDEILSVSEDPVKLQEAIENRDVYIRRAGAYPIDVSSRGGGSDTEWNIITGVDKDIEMLELGLIYFDVTQFGDFDIEFE